MPLPIPDDATIRPTADRDEPLGLHLLECGSQPERQHKGQRLRIAEECLSRLPLQGITLDDQGEAVAIVVSEVVGMTVFSGAGTVLSTVFSTVTVRTGGGEATSWLPPMRPRSNPISNPTSSPTASARSAALAGPGFRLAGRGLLLPIVLYPFTLVA